jgi:hypothetical protein
MTVTHADRAEVGAAGQARPLVRNVGATAAPIAPGIDAIFLVRLRRVVQGAAASGFLTTRAADTLTGASAGLRRR